MSGNILGLNKDNINELDRVRGEAVVEGVSKARNTQQKILVLIEQ